MPIKHPRAPKLDVSVVTPYLAQITQSHLTGPKGSLVGVTPDNLLCSEPHQNYFVEFPSILEGALLAQAAPKSWSYLLIAHMSGVGALEVSTTLNETGEEVVNQFVAVHHGTGAERILDALRSAEALPEVAAQDFELRVLQVPTLSFSALWLHAATQDILFPISIAMKALQAEHPYSESEILNFLQPLAATRAKNTLGEKF